MSKLTIAIFVVCMAILSWHAYAWYTYPCEAFARGLLAQGTAPARCVAR